MFIAGKGKKFSKVFFFRWNVKDWRSFYLKKKKRKRRKDRTLNNFINHMFSNLQIHFEPFFRSCAGSAFLLACDWPTLEVISPPFSFYMRLASPERLDKMFNVDLFYFYIFFKTSVCKGILLFKTIKQKTERNEFFFKYIYNTII